MAVSHNLPLLRHFWIQLPLQYDLHLPILQVETFNPRKNQLHVFQDAWRGQFSGKVFWFCHDVPLRRYLHDNFRLLCESAFPWSSLHHHACVCLGKKKSIHKVRDCHNFRFNFSVAFFWNRVWRMNFFGLLTFNAPYLPWVLLGFSLLLGNSVSVDLLGEE